MFDFNEVFEKAIVAMLNKYPFHAELLIRLKRAINRDVPTIGVCIKETGIELLINDIWFSKLTIPQQIDVLRHESLHCICCHFDREKALEPGFDRTKEQPKKGLMDQIKTMLKAQNLNVAEDIAINEYLPDIPKVMKFYDKEGNEVVDPKTGKVMEGEACTVDTLRKKYPNAKIDNKQIFEYYYHIMKEENKKRGKGEDGEGDIKLCTIDVHEGMNPDGLDEEYVKDIVKKTVNAAAEATRERHAGNVPSEIQALIDALNFVPKDWRNDLRKFVSKATESIVEVTRTRRNRRWGLLFPGHRLIPTLNLAVIADNSGSVAEEEFTQFCAELSGIQAAGANITFIQCDSKVNSVEKFNSRKKLTRRGCGGTCIKPAFDLVQSKQFIKDYGDIDGIILLTDGEIFDANETKKPKVPFLIAIIGDAKSPYTFGKQTTVKINKKR